MSIADDNYRMALEGVAAAERAHKRATSELEVAQEQMQRVETWLASERKGLEMARKRSAAIAEVHS